MEQTQSKVTEHRTDALAGDLNPSDTFVRRHIGPDPDQSQAMLDAIGVDSLDELIEQTVPASIRLREPLKLTGPRGESEVLAELKAIASRNRVNRSFIGQGYYGTLTPGVILRNILENPGWYTQYTPYQAEIAQGRLEALLNFQTMIADLTALPLANASLLDEATAAAEAMGMCVAAHEGLRRVFFVDHRCHPQTIAVVRTRAESMGIDCRVVPISDEHVEVTGEVAGVLVQYPTTDGAILDYAELAGKIHQAGALMVVATDLLALTLIRPPGEFGADIAVGSSQRFGVPMGFGGPHAGFMSTQPAHVRRMPGRLVGVSKDSHGNRALRLTLQTREQHIRREKATSNICTAQVLLAIIAGMYAAYHGPAGLKQIAKRVQALTHALASGLQKLGHDLGTGEFFDTLKVRPNGLPAAAIHAAAENAGLNLRHYDEQQVGISLDETTTRADVEAILMCFAGGSTFRINIDELATAVVEGGMSKVERRMSKVGSSTVDNQQPTIHTRHSNFLSHPVFNTHHTESTMLRYIKTLESRDLSLCHSMIPLGSCTMKLNATVEMIPVTWPEFGAIHPFAPADQTRGYSALFEQLESWLGEITGFAACSLQPNAGSAGEYAGLLAIRAFHLSRKDSARNVCLIPTSAHGTNPASAVIAGFKVVPVKCDAQGSIELSDLREKIDTHRQQLAAIMITYPSTHGVFEESVRDICKMVHDAGGQVYMDGANMNAQVGLCRPGDIGADVCHLNLHKTFCIPHGGGGPGMGPICVAEHLQPFLPERSSNVECGMSNVGGRQAKAAGNQPSTINGQPLGNNDQHSPIHISAAPYGSASILPIPWVYIALMGASGLKRATEIAILNANYMAKRLEGAYDVLFKGKNGRVAHEFVIDCRPFEASAGVKVEDIAKRLIDYGFHAPTMSWPVPGTLMIEPTESEDKAELDRFCEAMLLIRQEISDIESGKLDRKDNPLKNAPHTAMHLAGDTWNHPYSRKQATYPATWLKDRKFWPHVGRVDNPYGDRNLVCACPPVIE